MSELIVSVSGLRGIVGETLTDEVAERFVAAFCTKLGHGPVVVTRDGRANGPPLAEAVARAVVASGRGCLVAGVAATPTTGVLVRQHNAAGGVQVSASHNPAEYNGLKLFEAAGRVIPAGPGEEVKRAFEQGEKPAAGEAGKRTYAADTVSRHLELVAATCDVERIRSKAYRVVLDANHGSGAVLGVPLLEHLGCEVVVNGAEPDGLFAHPPEPTAENLESVLKGVADEGAAVGFCQDPDADRLALIDEKVRYIGEEYTLAICCDHVLRQNVGPIVTNCSTSRMSEAVASRFGARYLRTKVGEANVVDRMLEADAVLGGEGNGGVIDPRVGLVRDSFVGMALVLDAMAARGLPLSALADELPRYEIHKAKVGLAREQVQEAYGKLEAAFPEAAADRLDGLRLDWLTGEWLLVRPSNTEPIVRLFAEASTAEHAASLCEQASKAMGGA
ncbi:MAG: phosphoglucosamine mutase [Planctomycetota bacterium]